MKKLLLCISILLSIQVYSQTVDFGSKFIIQFKDLERNMEFTIVSVEPLSQTIEVSQFDSIFQTKPANNQIFGIFSEGKFGRNNSTVLILRSGLKDITQYKLDIKTPNSTFFQETSTTELLTNVKSVELWPFKINQIRFRKFYASSHDLIKESFGFKVKIDSNCLKHPDKNVEFGEQEFKTHIKKVIAGLKNKFELKEMLDYENNIATEDVSLGHYWEIGSSIYPNKKRFKFGDPITYKRVECPYFDRTTDYFYTPKEQNIKVVSYEWSVFKLPNIDINADSKDLTKQFEKKYAFLADVLTEELGKPLNTKQKKDSGRIDMKWKSNTGINAYLFRFSSYNRIRLFIYKE